jgi:hypothetical protein
MLTYQAAKHTMGMFALPFGSHSEQQIIHQMRTGGTASAASAVEGGGDDEQWRSSSHCKCHQSHDTSLVALLADPHRIGQLPTQGYGSEFRRRRGGGSW